MGIQTQFDNFHNTIKLGREDDAYRTVRHRDDSIKAKVKAAFREEGYPVTRDFIQGSLKTHTGIVPISGDYDIDRALVIDANRAPKNPVTPKKRILKVLERRGFNNARIKKPCVTADYMRQNIHIDFILYKQSSSNLYLAVGKRYSAENHRKWEHNDPIGLIEWVNNHRCFRNQNTVATLAQFRRLVRYVKRWRDVQFSSKVARKVFSIGITVMLKQCVEPDFSPDGSPRDLTALRRTLEAILTADYFRNDWFDRTQCRVHVNLPVLPYRDIFHGSSIDTGTQLRNKLTRFRDQLAIAEQSSNEREQCIVLKTLFGDDFKVPSPPVDNSRPSRARYASLGIVPHSQGA